MRGRGLRKPQQWILTAAAAGVAASVALAGLPAASVAGAGGKPPSARAAKYFNEPPPASGTWILHDDTQGQGNTVLQSGTMHIEHNRITSIQATFINQDDPQITSATVTGSYRIRSQIGFNHGRLGRQYCVGECDGGNGYRVTVHTNSKTLKGLIGIDFIDRTHADAGFIDWGNGFSPDSGGVTFSARKS
jgi:hypothetical protein